jgi:hypothetical protein
MKHSVKFYLVALFLFVAAPQVSQAYLSTSQTSLRLNDNSILFFVEYEFGHENFSYQLPIKAERGSKESDALGYDILKDGKLRTNKGDVSAAVLSKAQIKDGKYMVPEGESASFILMAFLTLPKDRLASSTDYSLAVSSLPFEIGADGEYIPNKLTKSELARYQTPVVGTDKKIGIITRPK